MRMMTVAATALLLTGCVAKGDEPMEDANAGDQAPAAGAVLSDAGGRSLATASLYEEVGGVRVELSARGMAPGTYGAHIHMAGRCDAPAFESAGGHWNPTSRQHGRDNPAGSHLGDMPNLTVGNDGTGSITFLSRGARLAGAGGVMDAGGAAVIVHAAADDYRTDPSGNSGARIACGVVRSAR